MFEYAPIRPLSHAFLFQTEINEVEIEMEPIGCNIIMSTKYDTTKGVGLSLIRRDTCKTAFVGTCQKLSIYLNKLGTNVVLRTAAFV